MTTSSSYSLLRKTFRIFKSEVRDAIVAELIHLLAGFKTKRKTLDGTAEKGPEKRHRNGK